MQVINSLASVACSNIFKYANFKHFLMSDIWNMCDDIAFGSTRTDLIEGKPTSIQVMMAPSYCQN